MANELVARNGLRVSGSTFLGSVSLDQTLTSTVLALDPTTNEVNYLSLVSADVHITGGTLTGTGDKDLQLVDSTGGTITISDVNIQTTGGTYDSATGIVTFTQNDGNTYGVGGWSYVESVTESNNAITVTLNDTTQSLLQIDAVTGVTYNNDWDLALGGTGTISASPVDLPFITGATFNAGTLTLAINGGLESDLTVDISSIDTYSTGMTLTNGDLVITLNDGSDFNLDAFRWYFVGDNGGANSGTINLESGFNILGGTGIITTSNGSDTLTIELDSNESLWVLNGDTGTPYSITLGADAEFVGGTGIDTFVNGSNQLEIEISDTGVSAGNYGSSSEVPVFDVNAQGQITGVTNTTIDGSAISNNTIVFNAPSGTDPEIALNGTLNLTSSNGSVVISGDSATGTIDLSVSPDVDTYATGGTISNGTLTIGLNNNTDFDVDGFEFLVGGDDASTITTTINGSFKISGGTGLNTTTNGTDTVTVNLDSPFTSGATYNNDGTLTLNLSDGSTSDVTGWYYLTGVTTGNVNGLVTLTANDGSEIDFSWKALYGAGYDVTNDWAIEFNEYLSGATSTSSVPLPFITGGTYDAGTSTITLSIHDGLESDITITGLDGSDTYVTGTTVEYSGATLDRNDGNSVELTSEQTIRVTASGASGTLFNVDPNVYQAVHVEYSMVEGGAARSGFFTAIFVGDQVEYADWSTVDLGVFTVNPELSATAVGDVTFTGAPGLRIIANTRAVAI